jgi:hypothetical protein
LTKVFKRACFSNPKKKNKKFPTLLKNSIANTQADRQKMTVKPLTYLHFDTTVERTTAYNSTYPKVAVAPTHKQGFRAS